ncbi:MAG: ribosome hibernation-promoting factor, HPF/YfiA family [Planctomycetota bacterium]
MKQIITLRDSSLGEEAREYARDRAEHLRHYFERITSIEIILSVTTNHTNLKRAEFILHPSRGAILVATAESEEIRTAIDRAHSEAKRELVKHKERLTDHHRERRDKARRRDRIL